jgi:hypothetical protein
MIDDDTSKQLLRINDEQQTALNPGRSKTLKFMAKKKTPVRVDPKRPKRKRKRGKGKSIKKSS